MTTAPEGSGPRGKYGKPSPSAPKRTCWVSGVMLFSPLQEQGLPAFFPCVPLIQQRRQVDNAVVEFIERAVHQAADRYAVARLDDLLAFLGQHKIHKQQRRVRMRRLFRHADAVG